MRCLDWLQKLHCVFWDGDGAFFYLDCRCSVIVSMLCDARLSGQTDGLPPAVCWMAQLSAEQAEVYVMLLHACQLGALIARSQ